MEVWQIILIVIACVIALAIVITLIKAALFKPNSGGEKVALTDEKVDAKRAEQHIAQAIQFKTISNPDPSLVDWKEFERFHEFLRREYPLIHTKLELEEVGQASLVYRWKGRDSSLEPMAMLAHQDVVPVADGTLGDWKHPPFDGVNDGEFIWGRGAMDMKNHLICVLEAVETLLEEGYIPERDIYICLGHNEEIVATPDSGAMQIAGNFEKRGIHLDSVLDEGGAILPAKVNGVIDKYLAGVGVAEKGAADYKISISAKGGHSSQPPKHTALGEIAQVTLDLENHQCKPRMLPITRDMFEIIGRNVSYPARLIMCNFRFLTPLIKKVLMKIPAAATFIHSTTAVTMSEGSPQCNVLPQKASITANFRILPGDSVQGIKEHIQSVVKNKNIEIEFLKGKEPSKISPQDSRAFKAIKSLCEASNPDNIVAPFLVMGGTDSYHYENVCDNIYRFSPFTVDLSLVMCTHGTNERLPVASIPEALKFFKRYIRTVSGK